MPPLSGLACTTDGHNIYIFGGKNEETRFNDLWMFNLKTLSYELLPANGDIPAVRNGHTMSFYNDRLYVFGGIHDITWELDDLHIYNLVKKTWTTLEQDSPRKI
jgi:N-acetylneuraminic acid mutarotase